MSVVSYVRLYADFWKYTENTLARTVFTQIDNLCTCMERAKLGCGIDK